MSGSVPAICTIRVNNPGQHGCKQCTTRIITATLQVPRVRVDFPMLATAETEPAPILSVNVSIGTMSDGVTGGLCRSVRAEQIRRLRRETF